MKYVKALQRIESNWSYIDTSQGKPRLAYYPPLVMKKDETYELPDDWADHLLTLENKAGKLVELAQ